MEAQIIFYELTKFNFIMSLVGCFVFLNLMMRPHVKKIYKENIVGFIAILSLTITSYLTMYGLRGWEMVSSVTLVALMFLYPYGKKMIGMWVIYLLTPIVTQITHYQYRLEATNIIILGIIVYSLYLITKFHIHHAEIITERRHNLV